MSYAGILIQTPIPEIVSKDSDIVGQFTDKGEDSAATAGQGIKGKKSITIK